MRTPLLSIICFFFITEISFSQNLVPNPSFEDTLKCPDFVSQIDYATGWHTLVNTPDYYNACNNTSVVNPGIVGVPNNARGYQPARTGNAYAGEVNYYTAQVDYRETFYAQLISPLSAGVTYDVGMWVVMNEDHAKWAVDGDFGIYLSNSIITPSLLFTYTPQIMNPHGNVLNDSLNWTKISGTFTAAGGEQYITIGSFIRDNQLTIIDRGGSYPFTSYAIDDVWVIPASGAPVSNFASSDSIFCDESGKCIDFFDHSSGNPLSWRWYFPGATPDSSVLQNPTNICYNTPGTYSVSLIVTNANGTDTLTVSPMITLGQIPAVPVLNVSNDTITCSHAFSYQWYLNGSPIAGATNSFYVYNQNGTYAVLITDSIGCSRLSNGVVITGISVISSGEKQNVILYPNPTTGEINLNFSLNKMSDVSIEICNVLGEKVFDLKEKSVSSFSRNISLENISNGIYYVRISTSDNIYTKKIILKK